MKRIMGLLLAGVLTVSLAGCGGSDTAADQTEDMTADQTEEVSSTAVTFTDDLGREVTVDSPQRVATLIGSFADIWCLAGGKDTLVATADDTWTRFDLGLSEDVANLGGITETNMEVLLAADPDFVVASSNTTANVELLETFEQAGITTAYFKVSNFEEYLHMLDICTQITGHPENYQLYGEDVQAQVDEARSRAPAAGEGPSVLYVRASGSSCKAKNSQDNVLGEMLADLGCRNIADSDTSLLEDLSMEAIIAADPDYIFLVLQGSDPTDAEVVLERALLSNPAWEGLTAVKEGRYYYMDVQLYNLKPNARWGEAYEKLADILYPAS